jgi:predicted dinucleotide-binding enzyme
LARRSPQRSRANKSKWPSQAGGRQKPSSRSQKAIGPTIIPRSLQDALKAEIILLAIPFGTYKDLAKAAQSWEGKIVIDVTNAYGVSPEELGNLPSSAVISRPYPAQNW